MTQEQEAKGTSAVPSHPADAQGKPAAPGHQGKPRQHDKVTRMGTESIPRLITEFAIPSILGMLVNGAYNVIDSIFLGQAMGEIGLSTATVAMPIMTVFMAIAMLIGNGGNALAALRMGEGKPGGGRAQPGQHGHAFPYRFRGGGYRHVRPGLHRWTAQRVGRHSRGLGLRHAVYPHHQPGLHLPVHRHGREQLHPHRRRPEPRAGHHDHRRRCMYRVQCAVRADHGYGRRGQRACHRVRPGHLVRHGAVVLLPDEGRPHAPAPAHDAAARRDRAPDLVAGPCELLPCRQAWPR